MSTHILALTAITIIEPHGADNITFTRSKVEVLVTILIVSSERALTLQFPANMMRLV